MITRIGHTAFNVQDMDRSLHFYCDILGFKKLFELQHPETGAAWIVYLKIVDGQFIELFYNGQPHEGHDNFSKVGYSHICLEVDDINQIANHLKSNGLTLMIEPQRGMDLNDQCWVKDPDGNAIEFMVMNPESPQMRL